MPAELESNGREGRIRTDDNEVMTLVWDRLPLNRQMAEMPGFEPGKDWRALSRLANECLKPLGHISMNWGESSDSNRYLPGSRPGAFAD